MNEKPFDLSVLYVEDEAITREEILQFLKRRVRDVFVARDGNEGLELFRQKRPDLVITDIRMPHLDGLKMAKAIRAFDHEVQIIVTTAHSDASSMMEAIDAGVDQYVLKPIVMKKLISAIGKCSQLIAYRRSAKQHLEERERLITELQEALAKVKLLSGFLPICASCKKIRNDQGYWQQIEAYIGEHSEAEFSHSICPDCAMRLYGKFYKEKK